MTGHGTYIGARLGVANEMISERARQDAKWGEQNHPSLPPYFNGDALVAYMPSHETAKVMVDRDADAGQSSWAHIAIEELTEALDAESELERRTELVQLGAVIVASIEAIDRRSGKAVP